MCEINGAERINICMLQPVWCCCAGATHTEMKLIAFMNLHPISLTRGRATQRRLKSSVDERRDYFSGTWSVVETGQQPSALSYSATQGVGPAVACLLACLLVRSCAFLRSVSILSVVGPPERPRSHATTVHAACFRFTFDIHHTSRPPCA